MKRFLMSSVVSLIGVLVIAQPVFAVPAPENAAVNLATAHREAFEKSPEIFFSEYNLEVYQPCLKCHEPEMVKKKFTTTHTKFRDGNYNLHFFHVNMKKGRTCKSCHDVTEEGKVIIREEVPFGTWSYPIDFRKTDIGGTCIVGCHAPKTYDRNNPKIRPSR